MRRVASPWSARRLASHPRPHRVRGFSCAHRNTVRRVILALVARSFASRGPIGGARRLVSPPLQRIEPAAAQQDAEEKSESEAARRSSRSFHDMPHSPSGSPESPRSRRPAPSSARFILLPTTRVSRLSRPARAPPSRPFPASTSTRSCASRRSGRSATTIASPTARSNFRSPKARCGSISSGRGQVHVYPDGSHAVFHGPAASAVYDEKARLKDDGPVKRAA